MSLSRFLKRKSTQSIKNDAAAKESSGDSEFDYLESIVRTGLPSFINISPGVIPDSNDVYTEILNMSLNIVLVPIESRLVTDTLHDKVEIGMELVKHPIIRLAESEDIVRMLQYDEIVSGRSPLRTLSEIENSELRMRFVDRNFVRYDASHGLIYIEYVPASKNDRDLYKKIMKSISTDSKYDIKPFVIYKAQISQSRNLKKGLEPLRTLMFRVAFQVMSDEAVNRFPLRLSERFNDAASRYEDWFISGHDL